MTLETLAVCPACGSQNFLDFIQCKDYTVSQESFHVKRCGTCGLCATSPRPTAGNAAAYYESTDYISHSSGAKSLMDRVYVLARRFTLAWKYSLVKSTANHRSLLDVGCGTGDFLAFAKAKGLTTFGTEPSAKARAVAQKKDVNVVDSIASLPTQTFDVITLWHVLEHIYDLHGTLDKLKERLNEHGTIFIAVPNYESPDAMHYKNLWAAYDVPRHVWHFSKNSMYSLLGNASLSVKKSVPMKLDAYYVSLLSEKYKADGKITLTGAIRGLYNGWKSNLRAKREKNYSSLIYVVTK